MQEALGHSSFGSPSGGVASPTQAMLMMQKSLSASGNNAAFPGSLPPTSSFPPLPGKDIIAAAAASLGGSTQASLMTQYYQMYQKLWGAALNNGPGSPNSSQLPSALHGGPPPPHVPLPPSLPSSMPTSSTSTNLLMSSSSALSSPSSTSSGLTSQASNQLEQFHHNSNSQGRFVFYHYWAFLNVIRVSEKDNCLCNRYCFHNRKVKN